MNSAQRSKDKKASQLGMNPTTASNVLKKDLMFFLAKKCGMSSCHQCGKQIETVDEFSVEHITPWLDSDNPKETFFDLENIAFSHLSCNIRAGRKPTKVQQVCGTRGSYQKGCRCGDCKEANASYSKARRLSK